MGADVRPTTRRRARRPPPRRDPGFTCARCGIVGKRATMDAFARRDACDAARDGNLAELEHLCNHHGAPFAVAATIEAAKRGRVDVIAWAFTERGPVNGFDIALGVAERENQRGAVEVLKFIKMNKYERRRAMSKADYYARRGGADEKALFAALDAIWFKLYKTHAFDRDDARAEMHVIEDFEEEDEDEGPTRAQCLARKILHVIDAEKAALSSATYVALCDALREVHELRVRREPKSLFDGVLFGPNRLAFEDALYEEHR